MTSWLRITLRRIAKSPTTCKRMGWKLLKYKKKETYAFPISERLWKALSTRWRTETNTISHEQILELIYTTFSDMKGHLRGAEEIRFVRAFEIISASNCWGRRAKHSRQDNRQNWARRISVFLLRTALVRWVRKAAKNLSSENNEVSSIFAINSD